MHRSKRSSWLSNLFNLFVDSVEFVRSGMGVEGFKPPCSMWPFASSGIAVSIGLESCFLVPGRVLIVGWLNVDDLASQEVWTSHGYRC